MPEALFWACQNDFLTFEKVLHLMCFFARAI